eukprot:s234_g37.t1
MAHQPGKGLGLKAIAGPNADAMSEDMCTAGQPLSAPHGVHSTATLDLAHGFAKDRWVSVLRTGVVNCKLQHGEEELTDLFVRQSCMTPGFKLNLGV